MLSVFYLYYIYREDHFLSYDFIFKYDHNQPHQSTNTIHRIFYFFFLFYKLYFTTFYIFQSYCFLSFLSLVFFMKEFHFFRTIKQRGNFSYFLMFLLFCHNQSGKEVSLVMLLHKKGKFKGSQKRFTLLRKLATKRYIVKLIHTSKLLPRIL